MVLAQVETEHDKQGGWVLPLKLVEKHSVATDKKSISQHLLGTNRYILQKYVGDIIIKHRGHMVEIDHPYFLL